MAFADVEAAVHLDVHVDGQPGAYVAGTDGVRRLHPFHLAGQLLDAAPVSRGSAGIDELVEGGMQDAPGCLEDEGADHDRTDPIDERPRRGDQGNPHRQRRRNRGDGVRTVVPGVGHQSRRVHSVAYFGGPPVEHFFDNDREKGRGQGNDGRA